MKLIALALATLVALPAFAAEKSAAMSPEMMQKMMASGTPGAAHRRLAEMAGDYSYTGRSWMAADQKAATDSTGTASMKMILGGRWLQYDVHGGAAGNMPAFDGMGLIGYDNVAKHYTTMWLDTLQTGATTGTAIFDADAKVIKENGSYMCPADDKEHKYRGEWKMLDKNSLVYSMWGSSPMDNSHKEFKMMELTFKRK